MIKKYKYIALSVAAVALASCTSTDEPGVVASSEEYISFAEPTVDLEATLGNFADSQHNTRSVSSWTSIDKFQVWGFCVPNKVEGDQDENAASQVWNDKSTFFTSEDCGDVFHNITVVNSSQGFASYDKTNKTPSSNNFKTWNEVSSLDNARYAFIAGYVRDGSGNFSMEKGLQTTENDKVTGKNLSHGPKLKFTITENSKDTTKVLFPENQPDALLAAKFDHRSSNGRVGLSFMHFMTGIRFKFHNSTSNRKLHIKKVTYRGRFHRSATFDFTSDEPVMTVSDEYAGKFTLFDGSQDISAGTADYMGNIDLTTGEIDPVTLLLLPNPDGTTVEDEHFTLGRDKEIRITYSIGDGKDKTFIYGKNFTLNYIPKPNTLHTAHFYFIGDEFVVMFQADDTKNWQNGSDNTVTIN